MKNRDARQGASCEEPLPLVRQIHCMQVGNDTIIAAPAEIRLVQYSDKYVRGVSQLRPSSKRHYGQFRLTKAPRKKVTCKCPHISQYEGIGEHLPRVILLPHKKQNRKHGKPGYYHGGYDKPQRACTREAF